MWEILQHFPLLEDNYHPSLFYLVARGGVEPPSQAKEACQKPFLIPRDINIKYIIRPSPYSKIPF